MRSLVTGATGFIGGALTAALLAAGWEVRALARPSSRDRLKSAGRFQVVEADLRDDDRRLREAVAGCDVVLHAAAIRNRWGTSPQAYHEVNVDGTRRLLEASIGRAKRFVQVSSAGVLGRPGVLGIDESFPLVTSKGNEYHRSKARAEQSVLARAGEIEVVVVRPTLTYGPGDQDGAITRLIALIARRRFIRVGNGRNHLHLTYIDDLTRGILQAAVRPAAQGRTFILAGPASISARDLIALIERLVGIASSRLFVPASLASLVGWGVELAFQLGAALRLPLPEVGPPLTPGKVDMLCAHRGFSSAAAARLLGYEPRVDHSEGLARTIEWMAATGRLSLPQQGDVFDRPPCQE